MKQLTLSIFLIFILNSSFAQDKWIYVTETTISGNISGIIQKGYIFRTYDSEYYVINELTLQLVLTLYPEVMIFKKGSDYKLIIEDFDEPVICKKLTNVIETQIDGVFEGWDGETIFKMMNGQIWQQSTYSYKYHYAYFPEVLIYEFQGSWIMRVEDVDETINVIKLK